MSEYVPEPWAFVLLALAAWRVWKLLADDSILDRPRDWALDHVVSEEFLLCPYCLGFWASLIWWGSWLNWPDGALVVATPWAISAAVGLLGTAWNAITD